MSKWIKVNISHFVILFFLLCYLMTQGCLLVKIAKEHPFQMISLIVVVFSFFLFPSLVSLHQMAFKHGYDL